MLEIDGVAELVDTFGPSLSQSTHLHGIERSASHIFLRFNLHFMVQPSANPQAALASGHFVFQWCNHSQSARVLLQVNVLANAKHCCRQPLKAKCNIKQTSCCTSSEYGTMSEDSQMNAAEGVSACCKQDRQQEYEDYGDGGYSESFQEYCLYARKR